MWDTINGIPTSDMRVQPVALFFYFIAIATGLTQASSVQGQVRWFDEYYELSWREERYVLGNFAHTLLTDNSLIGYIGYFVENDAKAKVKAGHERALRARRYLKTEFGIPESRIVLIYGGKWQRDRTVLQPLARSSPPPNFIGVK